MAPPAKVTPELRKKAAKMQASGSSLAEIAEATGISKARWGQLLPRAPEPGAPVSAAATAAAAQKLVRVERPPAKAPLPPAQVEPPPTPPDDAPPADLDPLAMLGRAARGLEKDLASLKIDQVAARRSVWQALTAVARIMEGIRLGRPSEDGPDEATARLVALRDAAIERMGFITGEKAAKLVEDRAALATWAGQELAPRVAAELLVKVDAMLGGPTS